MLDAEHASGLLDDLTTEIRARDSGRHNEAACGSNYFSRDPG
jgi:hypothetical protein